MKSHADFADKAKAFIFTGRLRRVCGASGAPAVHPAACGCGLFLRKSDAPLHLASKTQIKRSITTLTIVTDLCS